ncbi:MAG: isocitrate lyase/PEP mutase family protein [Oceanospirillaceae bacterium]|nr:isocitrate lyase/PEP mutase family protein [Oceanospirillaceae bacterium]
MNNIARKRMRQLLESNQCVACASVFDPLSIRMANDIGFKVGILGGSVASLMNLGAPDISLLTLSELTNQARRVCGAANLPVVVDGDSGYGNSLNVMRTVADLEHAGTAMITLEDTVLPRPHNKPAMSLTSIGEASDKLRAALKARIDPEFAIFARTHALKGHSLEELLERVKAYSKLGIDGICIFGLAEKDKLAVLAEVADLPLMLISYGDVDLGAPDAMAAHNVRIQFAGHQAFEESVKAVYLSLMKLYSREINVRPDMTGQDLISLYAHTRKYSDIISEYVSPA